MGTFEILLLSLAIVNEFTHTTFYMTFTLPTTHFAFRGNITAF